MNVEMAVDIIRNMIGQAILLISPLMITAIVVGLMVSLIQSITSIQEQTLTFVPKLIAVAVVIMISANWLLRSVVEFAIVMIQRIPDMAP